MATDWRTDAACRDRDPELFFPLPRDYRVRDRAKIVCQACPVRAACLLDALDTESGSYRYGVRGGFAETERRALQRRRAAGEDVTRVPVTMRANPTRPPRARGPEKPAHPRTTPGSFARPDYLAPDHVLVADDGTVTITDDAWRRVEQVLRAHFTARYANVRGDKVKAGAADRITAQHRAMVCGLLHRFGVGMSWRSLPEHYGPHPTLRKLQRRLAGDNRWTDVLRAVGVDLDAVLAAA